MKHPRTLRQFALLFLASIALSFVMAQSAFAQASGSYGGFHCGSDGRAIGSMYAESTSCPTTLSSSHVFSFVVCNMEELSSNLLGNVYCGMMDEMLPGIQAVLVLAVIFFGVSFTVGLIPMAAREFQGFLLKITIIYIFATQADYLIGFGYRFLILGIRDGIVAALSVVNTETIGDARLATGADVYQQLDAFLGNTIKVATQNLGGKFDGHDNPCNNAVFAAIALMAVAFPPMAYIAGLIMFKVALTFLRAVFAYIYALTGIAFLFTLAPFFLSFYLFRITRPFFDKWIAYMVSYTLQVVMLFAFMAFILSINVSTVVGSFKDIIVPVQDGHQTTSFRAPWEYCSLCKFKVVSKDDTSADPAPLDENSTDFIKNGRLVCIRSGDGAGAYTVFNTPAPNKPPGGTGDAGTVSTDQLKTLLHFTTSGLLSLLVLAYIVDALLRNASTLAQQLGGTAGAQYATQLGGGVAANRAPTVDIPGMGASIPDTRGREGGSLGENFASRFTESFAAPKSGAGDSVSRTAEGFKSAAQGLVGAGGDFSKGDASKAFVNWITDPNRM